MPIFDPKEIVACDALVAAGDPLLEWVRSASAIDSQWSDFRRIYKIAEVCGDAKVLAEFLIRIDQEPLKRSVQPSAETLGYFKRRGRRLLRKLSRSDPATYTEIAFSILGRAATGARSLPSDCWITWDLVFGRTASWRVVQARNGRGANRLLSFRPNLGCPQDRLLRGPAETLSAFRMLAENERLPWQTHESAVIRLNLQGLMPAPSLPLFVAYLESPSPLLHRVVADHLASSDVAMWSSFPPQHIAKCFFEANRRNRRLMLATLEKPHSTASWLHDFVASLFAYLEQDSSHPRRCVDALEAILVLAASEQVPLDASRIASVMRRLRPTHRTAFARVIAKMHDRIRWTCELVHPFVASDSLVVRRVGWWLASKRVLTAADIGGVWQRHLADDDDERVASSLSDTVAVAAANTSLAARTSIVDFLVSKPHHLVRMMRAGPLPQSLALRALRNPPKRLRGLVSSIWEGLYGVALREAMHAILDGASKRKHYNWFIEWLATSYSDELRGIFWDWACEPRNDEWLRKSLPYLGSLVDKRSAESIASRGGVALRLAAAGVFRLGVGWAASVTQGLKLVARSGDPKELVTLLAHVQDKHWRGCTITVSDRLKDDCGLNDAFWREFFAFQSDGVSGLERTLASEHLRGALVAVTSPSFLECDAGWASSLVEHWIVSNPSALADTDMLMRAAVNRNAAVRCHALRRVREASCDFVMARNLIESGLPDACDVGTRVVMQMWEASAEQPWIALELVDSPASIARNLGWDLFLKLYKAGKAGDLIPRLVENEDGLITTRLLELLSSDTDHAASLAALRGRVLLTASSKRAAKEEAKRHLSACPEQTDKALLSRVAHSAAKQDREWAIEQLVAMSLGGRVIDGVVTTTDGFV